MFRLYIISHTLLLSSRFAGCFNLQFSNKVRLSQFRLIRSYMTGSDDFAPKFNIIIPEDKIEVNYCRSSGPGGQNVNKVNTKAEIRFKVSEADWIPVEVRGRLAEYQSNKISKDGYLVINSQEHRLQARNKVECFDKLREMLKEAFVEPKERNMYTGIGEKGKSIRRQEKKMRSKVKESRRRVDFD